MALTTFTFCVLPPFVPILGELPPTLTQCTLLSAASRASQEGGHDLRTAQSPLGSIAAGFPIHHTYLQVQAQDGLNGCRSVHARLFVLSIAERVKEGFGGTFSFLHSLHSFLARTLHGHSFCFFLRFLTLVVIFHLTFVHRLSVHAHGAWI